MERYRSSRGTDRIEVLVKEPHTHVAAGKDTGVSDPDVIAAFAGPLEIART